jgi:nitronate monooxygenase
LVREVREFFDGPIALSGSISHGASVLSAQAMGADFAYIGTRFIATKEANATQGYKDMIVDSSAKDIMYSSTFTGVEGNYLRPSVENAGLDPENLPFADKNDMNFGSSGGAGDNQKKAWKDIWGSGQGIGTVHSVPSVKESVDLLIEEYQAASARLEIRA